MPPIMGQETNGFTILEMIIPVEFLVVAIVAGAHVDLCLHLKKEA